MTSPTYTTRTVSIVPPLDASQMTVGARARFARETVDPPWITAAEVIDAERIQIVERDHDADGPTWGCFCDLCYVARIEGVAHLPATAERINAVADTFRDAHTSPARRTLLAIKQLTERCPECGLTVVGVTCLH